MRFSVPQFIDVEDKLVGPLTAKQALYLIGSLGGTYIAYRFLGILGVGLIGVPLVAFAVMLGFVRINNRPSGITVAAAFYFKMKNKLYLWKKTPHQTQQASATPTAPTSSQHVIETPELTQSKLRALAFSLDTEDGYVSKDE